MPIPYDKIKVQRCLKMLIQGLPQHHKNNILYMYLKNETLYFATKHQAINFELYQKLSDIKLMLNLIQKKMNRCKTIKVSNIKAFTSYTKKQKININHNIKFYLKNPKGDFKNLAKNEKIHQAFEEIRNIIKNK